MRSGTCMRCGSKTVYSKTNGVNSSGGIYVYTGAITRVVPFVTFMCSTCGYFENYVADARKLEEVAQKWDRVLVS